MNNKISETSIIIPFYRKYAEFDFSIQFNKKYFQYAKEVILVLDEPYDINKFSYLFYDNINFKIFINQQEHDWRNPCITINYGIKNANGEYIIILSPETIIINDALSALLDNTSDDAFACGSIIHLSYLNFVTSKMADVNNLFNRPKQSNNFCIGPIFWGSICCTKTNFESVGLYDENMYDKGWGVEDGDVRNRLQLIGIQKKEVKEANFVHLQNDELNNLLLTRKNSIGIKRQIQNNCERYDNFIEYHPKLNNKKSICIENKHIIEYELNKQLLSHYNIILLLPLYNEQMHIEPFLNSVYDFVDGIIILDDDSSDDSYKLLDMQKYNKIIFKGRKKRNTFDDLTNRNILLDIYSQLLQNETTNDWIFWLDADERLGDTKNVQLFLRKELLNENIRSNILTLPNFHMWNETEYNAEYPSSDHGIQKKQKIFKNIPEIKSYQIDTKKTLHFQPIPSCIYEQNIHFFPLSIKHLGRNSSQIRLQKYQDYTQKYDTSKIQKSYDHFLIEHPMLKLFISDTCFIKKYKSNDI